MTWVDYELIDGNTRVELIDIGEGLSGDYDPSDPEDRPLVRFYVARMVDGEWEDVDDASYCTLVPTTITAEQRAAMAQHIMDVVGGHTSSIKKLCEDLSWMDEKTLGA